MVFIYLIICNGVVLFSISTGAEGFHRLFWFWGKVVRTRALLTAVRFLPFDGTSTAPLLHLWNRPFYTTRYFGQWRVGGFSLNVLVLMGLCLIYFLFYLLSPRKSSEVVDRWLIRITDRIGSLFCVRAPTLYRTIKQVGLYISLCGGWLVGWMRVAS